MVLQVSSFTFDEKITISAFLQDNCMLKAARVKMQGSFSSDKKQCKKQVMLWSEEVKILESDFFCSWHQSVHLLVALQLLLRSLANIGQISRQEDGLRGNEVPGNSEPLSRQMEEKPRLMPHAEGEMGVLLWPVSTCVTAKKHSFLYRGSDRTKEDEGELQDV